MGVGLGNLFQRKAVIRPFQGLVQKFLSPFRTPVPGLPIPSSQEGGEVLLPHGLSWLQSQKVEDGCAEYSLRLSLLFSISGPTPSSQPQLLETLPVLDQDPAPAGPARTTEDK